MNKLSLLTATFLIGIASTAVIATAKGGPGGERGAGVDQMFERVDTNQDGAITRAEIEAAGAARFATADTDGDGFLTVEEMTAAAESHDSERRAKRVEARLDRLDANDDGKLSLEEMQAGSKRLDRMFDRLDADSDGAITKAEAEAAKMHRGKGHRSNK